MTWAKDRALLGSTPSADPGAKTGAGTGGQPPVPCSLGINDAPGLASKRKTLAAGCREIRDRTIRPLTCANRQKFQFTVNQHTIKLPLYDIHQRCAANLSTASARKSGRP